MVMNCVLVIALAGSNCDRGGTIASREGKIAAKIIHNSSNLVKERVIYIILCPLRLSFLSESCFFYYLQVYWCFQCAFVISYAFKISLGNVNRTKP